MASLRAVLMVLLVAGLAFHVANAAVQEGAARDPRDHGGALMPIESDDDAGADATTTTANKAASAVFEPSLEWKEVPKDVHIPSGLDVRMDLEHGKRFARLIPGSRRERMMLHDRAKEMELEAAARLDSSNDNAGAPEAAHEGAAPANVRKVPVAQGGSKAEDGPSPELTEAERAARMRDILLGLPQPEPDLTAAVDSGMSGEQLDALVRRVWERRQQMLREASAGAKSEGQLMSELLPSLSAAAAAGGGDEALLPALSDLEYHVSSAHNAEDFRKMGGFAAIVPLLNSSSVRVRAAAAWLLGSAVKYAPENQAEAVAMAAQIPLAATLDSAGRAAEALASECPGMDGPCVQEQLGPAVRAAYALGSLVRGAPAPVLHAVVRSGVPSTAARAATALSRAAIRLSSSPEAAGTLRAAAIKCLGVLSDLVGAARLAAERRADNAAAEPGTAGDDGITLTGDVSADGEASPGSDTAPLDALVSALRSGPECAAAAHVLAAAGAEGHGGARSEFLRRAVRASSGLPMPCRVALATARGLGEAEAEQTMGAAVAALAAREAELLHTARGGAEGGDGEDGAMDDFADAAAAADAAQEAGAVAELLRQARSGLEEAQRQASRRTARA